MMHVWLRMRYSLERLVSCLLRRFLVSIENLQIFTRECENPDIDVKFIFSRGFLNTGEGKVKGYNFCVTR